jgi:murein DD-endopeptidase MepM/ murein hydrolase activator NlpD
MRRASLVLALLLGLLAITPASAATITAFYQPTPYPKYKLGGALMPQDLEITHIWDGYVGNANNTTLARNTGLIVGGYSDNNKYRIYIRFDTIGLPKSVLQTVVWFWPYTYEGSPALTAVDFYRITGSWKVDPPLPWSPQPSATKLWNRAAPTPNQWYGTDITAQYKGWRASSTNSSNWGLRLDPTSVSNRFDVFYSSRTTLDGARPILGLTFDQPAGMPNFKMPLPGNAKWLLTTEIGGYDCLAKYPQYWPDEYHTDKNYPGNYYALDFAPVGVRDNGASWIGDIPVIAAASGVVVEAANTAGNGNYVVIDHDGDNNLNTDNGFSTRYLHLKYAPSVARGRVVQQGDLLGYMGGSGTGTGVHLHFGIRYKGKGYSYTNELSYVTMDNWLMKSFQTECELNGGGVPTTWKRYYRSSNRVY